MSRLAQTENNIYEYLLRLSCTS